MGVVLFPNEETGSGRPGFGPRFTPREGQVRGAVLEAGCAGVAGAFVPVTKAEVGLLVTLRRGTGQEGSPTLSSALQEGTSKFATLEMNPKRAQRRPKEAVSMLKAGGSGGSPLSPPPVAALLDVPIS